MGVQRISCRMCSPLPKTEGINYWTTKKQLNLSDVWRQGSRIEGILVEEQILEVEVGYASKVSGCSNKMDGS